MPLSMGEKFSGADVGFNLRELRYWRNRRPEGQVLAASCSLPQPSDVRKDPVDMPRCDCVTRS